MGVLLSPTEVLLEVETKCRNPNIYSIEFGESPSDDVYVVVEDVFGNAGRVVAGQRVNSGSSMSSLPAHGNGSIVSDAKVLISSSLVTKLLPGMMKGKGVVVNLELRDEMKVEIPFLFGHVNINKSMNKKCGMRLAGLSDALQAKEPIGPLACANTWESLQVPSLKDLGDQEMVLTKERLGEGEIDTLELSKDIGLGGGSILLFFLGIIFTILTLRQLCCGLSTTTTFALCTHGLGWTGGSGADSDGEYSDCLE